MKRIGIDCRFASFQAGLGRYTRDLVTAMLQRDDPVEYVLLINDDNQNWLSDVHCQLLTVNCPHYSISEQIKMPKIIRNSNLNLFFSPHFNVPIGCPIPFVITIHDLILHHFPNQASFIRQLAYKRVMKHAVTKARNVITVSQYVAGEIEREYKRTGNVTVIQEGVDPKFLPASQEEVEKVRSTYGLSKPFLLYVGNAKEHKNVQNVIDAYQALDTSNTELVLVTGGKESSSLMLSDGVRVLSEISDADLPTLYSAALSFVTGSLYEGFCLPVAEALACNCPVIASNRTAIPEVTNSSCVLVEPSVFHLTEAMKNPPQRPVQPTGLSWDKAAEETAGVLLS